MNYIESFNRSRWTGCRQFAARFFSYLVRLDAARRGRIAAVPFAPVWCASMLPGVECCIRCTLFAVPGASMLPGVECCSRCTFCAVPGASMLPGVEYCRRCTLCAVPGVSMLPGVELLQPVHLCAVPGAPFAPNLLRYTYYSISQILEFLAVVPTLGSSL